MGSETARRHHWKGADSRSIDEQDLTGDRVEWLIDNECAYESLLRAVRDAQQSIWISQLAFDSDCKTFRSAGPDPDGVGLLDAMLVTAIDRRVAVKILLNSSVLLNTRRPLLKSLAQRGIDPHLVQVRGVSRFPRLLHAKIVVIDQRRAFIMGSPFVNGYWDSRSHAPTDERRPDRELGGRPVHDVSVGLQGTVVDEMSDTFARLWNAAEHRKGGDDLRRVRAPSIPRSDKARIDVVTTEPRSTGKKSDNGSSKTLDTLLDAIRRAESLIYVEHQYLSSRPVVAALRHALEIRPALEIIVLLNQNPDVTAYRRWQNERLVQSGLLEHPRVGVFALWTSQRTAGLTTVNQVFVHSKVVIIDDAWAMVGSANLDGASLDSYGNDFKGRLARRVFRDVRNFDVSIVIHPRPGSYASNPVAELRRRLWQEHLGVDEPASSVGGAVSGWREQAARNAASLRSVAENEATIGDTFVLPYSIAATPLAQLAACGVTDSPSLRLAFDPGWLEVRFSPNWIRNMFL